MNQTDILKNLHDRTAKAVAHYWETRSAQRKKQEEGGKADQGLRSAVTGGAQMDGFIDLFTELITQAGIPQKLHLQKEGRRTSRFLQTNQGMGPPCCPRADIDRCDRGQITSRPFFRQQFQ